MFDIAHFHSAAAGASGPVIVPLPETAKSTVIAFVT
jgi:hypothetical protein